MIKVKKGSTFSIALQFTEEEWEYIFPFSTITSEFKQGDEYSTLLVEADSATKCIFIKSATNNWKSGMGQFDVKITKNGQTFFVPELTNIEIQVVQGITR